MSTVTVNELHAIRAAFELQPLAAYIDAYDAGRVPANAIGYQVISQRIRVLLAPHVDNPHMRKLCAKSRSLCEILGNLVVEQERDISLRIECFLEELKHKAY